MSKEKLFLIDAYALIYRSYFAFIKNPRLTSKGLNTSAIYGFVNTVLELLIKEKPSFLGIGFDPIGPTFRDHLFENYKAQRLETPEAINIAIPYIHAFANAMGIPILEVPGYEADDVIGTVAKKFANTDLFVYMLTPDKDYGQLVDDNIFLYKPKAFTAGYEIIGKNEICEKYNIKEPAQLIDILSLWGDSSDNIPGIEGVGEKTAIKLIEQFGSVEKIYENIDQLQGKLKENLLKGKDFIPLAKKLVTIVTDVPVSISLEQLKKSPPNKEELYKLFDELEFRSLKQRFSEYLAPPQFYQPSLWDNQEPSIDKNEPSVFNSIKNTSHSYHLITTLRESTELIQRFIPIASFSFDTETTSLNALDAKIVGVSLCSEPGEAYFIKTSSELTDIQIIQILKPLLDDSSKVVIGQNLKYDLQVLKNYGVTVRSQIVDTMLAHYLLEPEQRHNLDYLALAYLNYEKITTESLIGKRSVGQQSMLEVDDFLLKDYACEDADITLQLWKKFQPMVEQNGLNNVFYNAECPLVEILADMEYTGVCLDTNVLGQLAKEYTAELIEIEKQIYQLAGTSFNIASPKQLGEILFSHLKIVDKPKLTKTKQYATGENVLLELKDKHPIVPLILSYRELQKLLNTYIESLPKMIHPRTGRIHTSFNQAITTTGRLSSANPNLQNIPSKEERGKVIRKAFVPSTPQHRLLSADYSQIELRIMAHFSQDENLLQAFEAGRDIHRETAAKLFGVSPEQVTPAQRNQAKGANFGIIYGISSFGLAQNTGLSNKEAKLLIDNYFKTFPKVKQFMDDAIAKARKNGFAETILGRKRKLPDINSANNVVRGAAERNAINTPIQGSAADLIKIAMIQIYHKFSDLNLKSKLILQVHDELVFDVPVDELEIAKEIVTERMLNAIPLNVKLKIDSNVGTNWYQAH